MNWILDGNEHQWRHVANKRGCTSYTFTILISSCNVQILEETTAVLSLGNSAKTTGYSYEGVSGHEPRLTKEGTRQFFATRTISYLLLFPFVDSRVFRPFLVAILSSTSTLQDSSATNPAQERNDGPGFRKLERITHQKTQPLLSSPPPKRGWQSRFGRPFARSS